MSSYVVEVGGQAGTSSGDQRYDGLTPMFGRELECAAVLQALSDPDVRLLTLTGRGGVGKTRLALEVTRETIECQRMPATFVPLAGVRRAQLVLPEIAVALGLQTSGDSPVDILSARLGGDEHLLVLDNLEHIKETATDLMMLLGRCPGLRILATSQTPLRLRTEHVVRIDPLPLPDLERVAKTGQFEPSEPAISTYVAAAASVVSGFTVLPQQRIAVAELCHRLEGLPLALQLAGARAATLGPVDVLRCLDELGVAALRRPQADAPIRHHDITETIRWTYDLLGPGEQRLLGMLSAGTGSFPIELVLVQAGAADSLDQLNSLVDFHLVAVSRSERGNRYAVPTSIRNYALERAAAASEVASVRSRFVSAWAELAGRAASEIEAGTSIELTACWEADGLGSALQIALDDGLIPASLDLVRVLAKRWDSRGYHTVHEELLEQCIAAGDVSGVETLSMIRASVWSSLLGLRHWSTQSREVLLMRLQRAESIGERTGDDATLLFALNARLLSFPILRDIASATRDSDRALQVALRLPNRRWLGAVQVWSGMLSAYNGDLERAVQLGREALIGARTSGDEGTVVRSTLLLRPLVFKHPELRMEVPSYEEALAMSRRVGEPLNEAIILQRLIFQEVAAGRTSEALMWSEEALVLARVMAGSPFVLFQLSAVVSALNINGELRSAARLHGVVRPFLSYIDAYDTPPHRKARETLVAHLRRTLGDDVFDTEVARADVMNRADAVEFALDAVRECIERIAAGLTSPAAKVPTPLQRSGDSATARLTERQNEVLGLLAKGMSNKDIARALSISAKTVMHHTMAIYRELGVNGRNEATAWVLRPGAAVYRDQPQDR